MSSSDQSERNANSELSNPFPIVGIGASAGGLEALENFFSNVSEDSGITYIILVHSSPDQVSLLPEILQRCTSINVALATDGQILHPNQIYVIPPQTTANINQGRIELQSIQRRQVLSSIDSFFRSLAENKGNNAVAVVLSGMGSDGSLGVKEIKSEEGLVIAQSEDTAFHKEMPRNAILTGVVDTILPPQSMPETIQQYFEKRTTIDTQTSQEWLEQIFMVLRSQLGHDFSCYKNNTLTRRINRRMSLQQVESYSQYLELLRHNHQEAHALYREFLIGVTNFFRDPEAFEFLKQEVLTQKLEEFPNHGTFRVWVPGCSTGEEVYSIAIILQEILDEISKPIDLQIFGTDIDQLAIDRAREGIFPVSIAADVSEERLNRFFQLEGTHYRVGKEIRYSVVFSVQNLLKDPPFSRLNFLSCRNLLIYLNESAQKKLLPLFHYTLVPSGILMLGSSETIGSFQNLFEPLSSKWKIFQHREIEQPLNQPIQFPTGSFRHPTSSVNSSQMFPYQKEETNFGRWVKEALLEQFSPTAVLIENNGLILHVQGRTGKFLETVSGPPTHNILDMAREGLRTELSSAIRTAASSREIVTRQHIPVKSNGDTNLVKLSVKPLEKPEQLAGRLLVLLEVIEPNLSSDNQENTTEDFNLQQRDNRIAELEKELQETRENHQTTIEELESSNEELQATNEELESSNEELQATNEELESSKEELQSLNEELQTVNEELQNKVDELSAAENDMQNFLNSTEIATLFVDSQMQVKRFTPEVTNLINLIPRDIGRPIQDLSTNLIEEEFITDLQNVLDTLYPQIKTVQTREGKWYRMKILPYRTSDNRIEGVILTFIDIDELKTVQDELERINRQLEQSQVVIHDLIEASSEPLVLLDKDRKIVAVSQPFQELIAFLPRRNLSDWEALLSQQLESKLNTEEDFSDAPLVINSTNQERDRYLVDGKIIGQNSTELKYILLKINQENS